MGSVLAMPWVASLLGLVLGTAIVTPLLWSVRLHDASDPSTAWSMAGASIVGGLGLAIGVMFLYSSVAPVVFPTFGVSVVIGFLAALTIGAVVVLRRQA